MFALPATDCGQQLGRNAVGFSQLQRSLEALLEHAERLTDQRLLCSQPDAGESVLCQHDCGALNEMHNLVSAGLASLLRHMSTQAPLDLDETCAREIELNAAEARTRRTLFSERGELQLEFGVFELIDAYEAVGNQVYRLADALCEVTDAALGVQPPSAAAVVSLN